MSKAKVLKEVLKEIKPKETEIKKEANSILNKINILLKKNGLKAKAVMGGSIAKGTSLKGDYDCDIFVKFNRSYKDQDISKILGKTLRPLKPKKVHGSRDYFHLKNNINYEIVPVLEIKEPIDAVNVTDCSPLHVAWVKKQVKKNPKIKDEIRLAKAFCKGIGVYGAESYIKGFSGHVIDILTVNYRSFKNLLIKSKNWKKGQIIDIYNYHKGNAKRELNKSKLQSALIVIDPVDKNRNAAAVLSEEKMKIFKSKAARFLKRPGKEFFVRQQITIDELSKKAKGKRLIVLNVKPLKGKNDVVGAKILKIFEYLNKSLAENDFNTISSGWQWDRKSDALLWFMIDSKELSQKKTRAGPPLTSKTHVPLFRKKHKKAYEKKGRLYADIRRKHTLPEKFIKDIIEHIYIKERSKSIKIKNPEVILSKS